MRSLSLFFFPHYHQLIRTVCWLKALEFLFKFSHYILVANILDIKNKNKKTQTFIFLCTCRGALLSRWKFLSCHIWTFGERNYAIFQVEKSTVVPHQVSIQCFVYLPINIFPTSLSQTEFSSQRSDLIYNNV